MADCIINHLIFRGPKAGLDLIEDFFRTKRIDRTYATPTALLVDDVRVVWVGDFLFVRCDTWHAPLDGSLQEMADLTGVDALSLPAQAGRTRPARLYRRRLTAIPLGDVTHPLTVERARELAAGIGWAPHWVPAVARFHAHVGFAAPTVSVEELVAPPTEQTILFACGIRFTGSPRHLSSDILFGEGNPLELYRRDQPGEPERWLAAMSGWVEGVEVEGAGASPDEAVFEFRCDLYRTLRKVLAERDRAARVAATLAKGMAHLPPLDEAALLKAVNP